MHPAKSTKCQTHERIAAKPRQTPLKTKEIRVKDALTGLAHLGRPWSLTTAAALS